MKRGAAGYFFIGDFFFCPNLQKIYPRFEIGAAAPLCPWSMVMTTDEKKSGIFLSLFENFERRTKKK
jgi:hypothetical protein